MRTIIPRHKRINNLPGEVKTYFLSEEELAKYRALPVEEGKKPVVLKRKRGSMI